MDLIERIAKDMWELEKKCFDSDKLLTWNDVGIDVKEYWVSQAVKATQTIMSWLKPRNTSIIVPSDDFTLYLRREIDKSTP